MAKRCITTTPRKSAPFIPRETFTCLLVLLWTILVSCQFCHVDAARGYIDIEGRHSFSLSTFDPSGKLQQVEYAAQAAALGTPVVVVCRPKQGLFLASPQVLPSLLVHDDGTARFSRIAPHLVVAGSGLSADGRAMVAAAQQLAVQHEYAYDEVIPVDLFLEELSLLFQDYTMRAGSRPFGVTLVVAHLAPPETTSSIPTIYRIDPSGAVESLGDYAIINGNKLQTDDALLNQLKCIAEDPSQDYSSEDVRSQLADALQEALLRQTAGGYTTTSTTTTTTTTTTASSSSSTSADEENKDANKKPTLPTTIRRIVTASLTCKEGMIFDRYDLPKQNALNSRLSKL